MNILIYRTGRLGDFLVAVPAVNLVRRAFPEARITLLTCASTKQSFAEKTWTYANPRATLPWIELITPHVVDSAICFNSLKDWRELMKLARKVRSASFDRGYILPFTWERRTATLKKKILLRCFGVKGPIFGGGSSVQPSQVRHQVDSAIAAVAEDPLVAAIASVTPQFSLRISDADRQWVNQSLQSRAIAGKRLIAIFVGGTYEHKRWPVDNFSNLCRKLACDRELAFVFIGSKSERSLAAEALKDVPAPCWNCCGETTLTQLAAVIEKAELFVGNDSGPGHLAAALGTPCVTFIAQLYPPGVWEPRGSASLVLRQEVPCQFCRSETHCPQSTQACIKGISVAEAYAGVVSLLAGSK